VRDRPTLLVGAALAAQPGNGGHAWVLLHWLLGLRRSGYDVLLVDRMPPDPADAARGAAWVRSVLDPHGLAFSLLDGDDGRAAGVDRCDVIALAHRSVGLVNIMGFVDHDDVLAAVPRRVFLDIDPGFGQFWFHLGLADVFDGHDAFATVGLNVGRPGCEVPTCGRTWVHTVPPVVLDAWPDDAPAQRGVTTVATWRGIYGPIEVGGERYGLRVHEFRRFAELAADSPLPLQPAMRIHPEDDRDRTALETHGWFLDDPAVVAATPGDYRRFVSESTAELCIAKELYVKTRSGWFSDRSACYLAAGRPVVAQDTGFAEHLPTGAGLLAFASPDEALAALHDVAADWRHHSDAARKLAAEHFDAENVLPPLLAELGIDRP
jgi:hypothetical protein